MKSTSAAEVIIHALWPGPATPTAGVVNPAGMVALPSLSLGPVFNAADGSPLPMYASRPAMRCSREGAGGGVAGAGAAACANAEAVAAIARQAANTERIGLSRRIFMWSPRL